MATAVSPTLPVCSQVRSHQHQQAAHGSCPGGAAVCGRAGSLLSSILEDATFWIQAGFTHLELLVTPGRLQPGRGLLGRYSRRTVSPWPQEVILLDISLLKTWASSSVKQDVDTQRSAAGLPGIWPGTSWPLISDQSPTKGAQPGLDVGKGVLVPYTLHYITRNVFIFIKVTKANHSHEWCLLKWVGVVYHTLMQTQILSPRYSLFHIVLHTSPLPKVQVPFKVQFSLQKRAKLRPAVH